jgi:hypothetical protein
VPRCGRRSLGGRGGMCVHGEAPVIQDQIIYRTLR